MNTDIEALNGCKVIATNHPDEKRLQGPRGLDVRVFPSGSTIGAHVVIISADNVLTVLNVVDGLREHYPVNFMDVMPDSKGGYVTYGRVGWEPTTQEVGHG